MRTQMHVAIIILLFFNMDVFGQQFTGVIKGKIIELSDKRPVIGATVSLLPGIHSECTTDSSGIFTIKNVPEGNYSLIISSVGFHAKTVQDIIVTRNKTFYLETELYEKSDTLSEVTIKTFKDDHIPLAPVSSFSLSREEIFRIPGSQGDIFRAIGILPGVTSSGGQYSAISVRGQGTRDNVYMVDDIPLFEITHLSGNGAFDDPNGGRFSIFAPRVIDNAQFQGGGFAAEYGRKSSSYLGLGIKEGNNESPSLTGQFDLLGFTLIYDGPSYTDKKTSVFASARYQNFTLLEKVVGLKGVGLPSYGDYMIKTTTQINPKNKLSIIAMVNPEQYVRTVADVAQVDTIQGTDIVNAITNKSLIGINLRTLTGKKSYWKNILYYRTLNQNVTSGVTYPTVDASGKITNRDSIPFEPDLRTLNSNQKELGYRSIFTQNFNKASLTTGIDLARIDLDYSRNLKHTDTLYTYSATDYRPDTSLHYLTLSPEFYNSGFKGNAINFSGYADLSFRPWHSLLLNTGLRFDYTGFTGRSTLSPRISGSLQINEKSSINFATGIYYQDPEYDDIADQGASGKLKSERTIQYILGFKRYFTNGFKLTVDSWYKTFSELITRVQSDQPYLNNNGTGNAYGLDISVTKKLSDKYYGQIAYSYISSARDNRDGLGAYNYTFSQPNIISLLASYQPGIRWAYSAKFRYATGRPKDSYIIHPDVFNSPTFIRYSQQISGPNASRLNDYISLDIRVDYHTQLNKLSVTAFIDVVNVTNRFNQSGENFQPITGRTYYDGLGIFPSFGIILGL